MRFPRKAARVARAWLRLRVWGCFWRWGSSSDFRPQLRQGATTLEEFTERAQKAFLRIGSALTQQVEVSQQLEKAGQKLSRFARDEESGSEALFNRSSGLLDQVLQFMGRNTQRCNALLAGMKSYQEQAALCRKDEMALNRALAPMRFIESLFRIESAALPPEVQKVFEGITENISRLEKEVRSNLAQQFASLGDQRQQIGRTRTALSREMDSLAQQTLQKQETLGQSIAKFKADIVAGQQRQLRFASLLSRLAEETGSLVVSLQYQDITAQRMAHVREAVEELLESQELPDRAEERQRLRRNAQACQIEAGQIEAVHDDLERVKEQVETGVGNLAHAWQSLDAECLSIEAISQELNSIDRAFQSLLALLGDAISLVEQSHRAIHATCEALEAFAVEASGASSTLRELSFDILLIALNAQVQAAQVGQGTGLETLAQHTCLLSNDTNAFAHKTGAVLAQLVGDLKGIVSECQSMRDDTAQRLQQLRDERQNLQAAIASRQEECHRAVIEMQALIQRSQRGMADLARSVQFDRLSPRETEALRQVLKEMASECERRAPSDGEQTVEDELSSLQRRYTMAAERDVHERGVRQRASAPLSAQAETAAVSDPSDNFELF